MHAHTTNRAPHRHRRSAMIVAAAGVAAIVASLGAEPATAYPPGPTVRAAHSQVAFAGTTFDTATDENVDLAGALHVRTLIRGSDAAGWTVLWLANLSHTTGTGATNGDRYVLRGLDAGAVQLPPGPPTRTAFLEPSFALRPSGSGFHPPSPCRLLVALSFDAAGSVTDVQVHVDEPGPVGPVD